MDEDQGTQSRDAYDAYARHAHDTRPIPDAAQQQPQFVQNREPLKLYRPIPRRNFSTKPPDSHSASHSNENDDSPNASFPAYNRDAPSDPSLRRSNGMFGSSDWLAQLNARLLRTTSGPSGNANGPTSGFADADADDGGISKSQSFLNLTKQSTLFGIMGEGESTADTSWSVGAETPGLGMAMEDATMGHQDDGPLLHAHTWRPSARRKRAQLLSRRTAQAPVQKRGPWRVTVVLGKLLSLFVFGAVYGVIVAHLHDARELAAVNVGGADALRGSWRYVAGWGIAGLVFGTLLPYVDLVTNSETTHDDDDNDDNDEGQGDSAEEEKSGAGPSPGEKLNELLRGVAAFAGIAFAIRRLPWESTLQLTFTLALVNPALWYILDRTRNGLSFSFVTTTVLTSFIFLSNPNILPSPALPSTSAHTNLNGSSSLPNVSSAEEMFAGLISYDNLATMTWVGSVIFCSCICFGGIGRRSAVLEEWGWVRPSSR